MKGATQMQLLQTIIGKTMPSSHPRSDDLLGIGGDLSQTLGTIQRDLEILDQEYRRSEISDTDWTRDALNRLLAQRGWIKALLEQYEQIRSDLSGEGFALLGPDGTGIPYFHDDRGKGPRNDMEGGE